MTALRVRVLHVVRPAAGGIRQHVLNLLRHTDRTKFAPSLAAPVEFLQALPLPEPASLFPLEIAAALAPLTDLRAARRLTTLTRGADVVHAHGLRAGWVAALAHLRRPFPLVVTAHNLVENAGWFSRGGLRLIGRRATSIIAVSDAVADTLAAQGIRPGKVIVIPNGIDVDYFTVGPGRMQVREALAVPTDAFVVGCVARLSSEKGVDVLLRAASLRPEMLFLVAGEGPQRSALEAALPPNVRLLGRINDTRRLLNAADALAAPSRQEGQGIAALEAMAAGIPLVASRVGGLAGMLTDDETALLVPMEDPDALAAALSRLQNDPTLRERLTSAAGALTRKRYDVRQMARAIERVYTSVQVDAAD